MRGMTFVTPWRVMLITFMDDNCHIIPSASRLDSVPWRP